MTDGIGRIFGGSSYGVGGYVPQNNNNKVEDEEQQQAQAQPNYEETQVDPSKVMDFLANNNYFLAITNAPGQVEGVETDPTVADRVAGYMENFEVIYSIIEQEFGAELAPSVMDLVMDALMGMLD